MYLTSDLHQVNGNRVDITRGPSYPMNVESFKDYEILAKEAR